MTRNKQTQERQERNIKNHAVKNHEIRDKHDNRNHDNHKDTKYVLTYLWLMVWFGKGPGPPSQRPFNIRAAKRQQGRSSSHAHIRVWLKVQELGLHRFWSLIPFTKGPFEYILLSHSHMPQDKSTRKAADGAPPAPLLPPAAMGAAHTALLAALRRQPAGRAGGSSPAALAE